MRINEKGRSMIEMLGVLAIIGVLSVGGIAGYSKAMAKFKANKTIDLISHTVANTRILFGSQNNYADLGAWDTTVQTMAYNAKLFPDENMKSATQFVNAYAGNIGLYSGDRFQTGDHKAFVIALTALPQSACIDLATQDWAASSGAGFVAMAVEGATSIALPAATAGTLKTIIEVPTNTCASTTATTSSASTNDTIQLSDTETPAAGSATPSILCGRDGQPMSTIVATKGCSGADFNNIYLKFF